MNFKKIILTPILLIGLVAAVFADGTKDDIEVLYKYRFGVDFNIKLAKGLKLDLEPEFRFNDGLDQVHINGGLTYKTFGCIYWGATYRMVIDREESDSYSVTMMGNYNTHDCSVYHRYAFDVTYKETFGRFTPSFRLRYNNFADEEVDDKEYMRYRAKVEYNIRKCKITPHIAIEAYQQMEQSKMDKMRYSTGFDLKTSKTSALTLDYKFDMFLNDYKNANIFCVGYKFKF